MASIEGGNNAVTAVGGGAGAGDSSGISAAEMADNLINTSTGYMGLEPDRLAAHVDNAMQSLASGMYEGTGLTDGFGAADLEAAVMDRLSPREQGQFQSTLDVYRGSFMTTPAQQVAMNAPFRIPTGELGINTATNPYGTEVPSMIPTESVRAYTAFDRAQAQARQDAWDNLGRMTGGPISGLATSIAVGLGADQRTIELVHGLGLTADGLTAHMGPGPEGAMR